MYTWVLLFSRDRSIIKRKQFQDVSSHRTETSYRSRSGNSDEISSDNSVLGDSYEQMDGGDEGDS